MMSQGSKYILHGKIAASFLLKLFLDGNKRCHITDTTLRMAQKICSPLF